MYKGIFDRRKYSIYLNCKYDLRIPFLYLTKMLMIVIVKMIITMMITIMMIIIIK